MSIKEQIESLLGLLDDELPTFLPANEPKPLTVADLKALAASHTALLKAAKGLSFAIKPGNEKAVDEFCDAIEEAEKL